MVLNVMFFFWSSLLEHVHTVRLGRPVCRVAQEDSTTVSELSW